MRRISRRSTRISRLGPAHTRAAYLRDAAVLATLAGASDLAHLRAQELRRFLATLHGRGLSGRSLARMLSSWRALYRLLQDQRPRRRRKIRARD